MDGRLKRNIFKHKHYEQLSYLPLGWKSNIKRKLPVCLRICSRKFIFTLKDLWHISHENGLTPE